VGKPLLVLQDPRCPLGLKVMPTSICPLAADRLRALQNGDANTMVGCEFYINDVPSNLCFFSYMHNNAGMEHQTIDISSKLLITQATVYSSLNKALEKAKEIGLVDLILDDDEI
jgi:hypothetical protein